MQRPHEAGGFFVPVYVHVRDHVHVGMAVLFWQ